MKDIKYIGVNDYDIDLFEGQYIVENGMAYNSYVICDEKIAVMDSVGEGFGEQWIENIKDTIGDSVVDYLVVQHMEPDHSANVAKFMQNYTEAKIVATAKAFTMMKQFFGTDFSDRQIVVKDGDTLTLGKHTLDFTTAPMLHWPEVMVTYDEYEKVLFSADAFGKFGTLDTDEDWACEARRYYFGIVGKYGMQAQKLVAKAKTLDIATICPLHGPILNENLEYYINLYDTWSKYESESEGVMIAYTSVYGNTKAAAFKLGDKLTEMGCKKVVVCDLAREDMAEAVEDAFRYGKLVLATTTYNGEIFPFMKQFIDSLTERNYQNRFVGLIENGSWAPVAAKVMRSMFEKSKNIVFAENTVTIKSALDEQGEQAICDLANELMN